MHAFSLNFKESVSATFDRYVKTSKIKTIIGIARVYIGMKHYIATELRMDRFACNDAISGKKNFSETLLQMELGWIDRFRRQVRTRDRRNVDQTYVAFRMERSASSDKTAECRNIMSHMSHSGWRHKQCMCRIPSSKRP